MSRSKKAQAAPDANPTEKATETLRRSLPRDEHGKIIASTVVRFWELVAEKRLRESPDARTISEVVGDASVLSIIRETGLPRNVVYGMANGTLAELPLWIVEPLCTYLGATPAELLGPREGRAANLVDAVMPKWMQRSQGTSDT